MSAASKSRQEVNVGDELPELVIPITATAIVGGAIASRDFTPVHHDTAYARFDPKEASDDEVYVRLRNRESTVLFGWSPYMYNPKLAGRLHRIRIQTLVLWGASDRVAPAAYGSAFANRIPGARFDLVENAGRFPHVEQPAELARRIAEFAGT